MSGEGLPEVRARFARSIVRVMREEHLECNAQVTLELAEDLWTHAKRGPLGAHLPETAFAESFDMDTLLKFIDDVQLEHREQTR